jgi:hypothetical protein
LAIAAMVVLGYRATSLAEVWRGYDRQLGEFRAALTGLEGDAPRLLMAVNRTDKWHDWMYDHIGSLGIIDRHAYVSILYSIPGQQVVRSAGPLAPAAPTTTEGYEPVDAPYLGALAGAPGAPAVPEVWRYLRDWPCHFDYAAVLGPDRGNPAPAYLAQVKAGSFFTLYRVRPADRCPAVGSTSPARR